MLMEIQNFSHLICWLCSAFIALIIVEEYSFYTHLLEVFIIRSCWILSNAFPSPIEIIIMYHVCWFTYVEPSMCIWVKFHLVQWMICLSCCWIWLGSIILRIFASVLIRFTGLWFYLLFLFLILKLRWYWPCRRNLGGLLTFNYFA